MQPKNSRHPAKAGATVVLGVLAAAGIVVGATTPAAADMTVYDQGGKTLALTLGAGFGLFDVSNPNFGAGIAKTRGGTYDTARWTEGFINPGLAGSLKGERWGTLYGGVSAIGAATRGTGDASGTTQNNPQAARLELAYAGWRLADPLDRKENLDLSVGRQNFQVGDGFLISDGNFDTGRDGAFYLGPRTAWANSAILRTMGGPMRADLFWLRSDKDSGDDHIEGLNVEYVNDRFGTVGGMAMRLPESRINTRNGMVVYDLRAQGRPVPGLHGLFLASEYTKERNTDTNGRLDANAWYGEAGYTLEAVSWKPTLSYRYAHFSGDNPSSSRSEAFDALHYGPGRGWGTWFMGEIAGQYLLANSNENVNMVHLTAQPLDSLAVGTAFYDFAYDRTPSGVTSKDYGREIDIHADWTATPWLTVSGAVGRMTPGEGAKQATGSGKAMNLAEMIAAIKF